MGRGVGSNVRCLSFHHFGAITGEAEVEIGGYGHTVRIQRSGNIDWWASWNCSPLPWQSL